MYFKLPVRKSKKNINIYFKNNIIFCMKLIIWQLYKDLKSTATSTSCEITSTSRVYFNALDNSGKPESNNH